jgi:hypothetical protein
MAESFNASGEGSELIKAFHGHDSSVKQEQNDPIYPSDLSHFCA